MAVISWKPKPRSMHNQPIIKGILSLSLDIWNLMIKVDSHQKPSINKTLKHHLKDKLRHHNLNHFRSSLLSQTLTHNQIRSQHQWEYKDGLKLITAVVKLFFSRALSSWSSQAESSKVIFNLKTLVLNPKQQPKPNTPWSKLIPPKMPHGRNPSYSHRYYIKLMVFFNLETHTLKA